MTSLLHIELRKLLSYRTFWVIVALQCVLLYIFFYARGHIMINGQMAGAQLYQFPKIWSHLVFVSSFLSIIPGILVIILVTDEYTFRTFRQQVIDGFSRADLVQGKYSVILLLAFFWALYVLGLGLGFGLTFGNQEAGNSVFTDAHFVFYYLVQLVGYMSLAMLVAFLVRKSGLAILLFMAYTLFLERLVQWNTPDAIDKYFPMKVLGTLTPNPNQQLEQIVLGTSEVLSPMQALVPAVLYISLFCLLSYYLLKVRDL